MLQNIINLKHISIFTSCCNISVLLFILISYTYPTANTYFNNLYMHNIKYYYYYYY
jgi:hypothetical protein